MCSKVLIGLPRDMIWLESIFKRFPLKYENLRSQLLARVLFLATIWISGYLIYSLEGLSSEYLSNIGLLFGIFATSLLPIYGTYMVQKSLPLAIDDVKPLLDLSSEEFEQLDQKIEGYVYSFTPVFIMAVLLLFLVSDIPQRFMNQLSTGFTLRFIWDALITFFFNLINGTGIWLGLSIWITVLNISKQPFKETYNDVDTRFRGLAMLVLWFSAFYFISISLGVATSLIDSPAVSLLEILFSPFIMFLLLGFVWVLFPFFNIHQALSQIKKSNLESIKDEYQALTESITEDITPDESILIIRELLNLQLKEKMISNMEDWPINIGYITKLLTLVLIPAIVRITIELFNRYIL